MQDHVKVSDMLHSTSLLSINQMIGYCTLMEMWKSRTFEIPHLSGLLTCGRNDTRTLRSDTQKKVTASVTESFAISVERLWNNATDSFKGTNLLRVAKAEAKRIAKLLPF